MWRSLWRSFDRFSLHHFKHVINELRQIKVVNNYNRELVVDLLQSVVEIVTYGDRQDPLIFECFMEYQVLAEFVRLLKISRNSRIEAPLLQYLSIMLQNMDSEHAIYYCFSNDYVNNIMAHNYKFDAGDLAQYYISFLRAVSSKINRDTLCLLVKVQGDVVVSFPLYSEALKFAQHGEKMIQTAVRALTLNIYNGILCYAAVFSAYRRDYTMFITTPPVSKYFSDLVNSLKEQCINLDKLANSKEEMSASQRRKEVLFETDKIVDDLYYLKDIICIGESRLSEVVTQNILDFLVCPILLPLQLKHNDGLNLSAVTSLYVISRILQVIGGKSMTNSMAGLILYPGKYTRPESTIEDSEDYSSFNHSNGSIKLLYTSSESAAEDISGKLLSGELAEFTSCNSQFTEYSVVDSERPERSGILSYIFSENVSLQLASLFLLLTLADSKDLELFLPSTVCSNSVQQERNHGISSSFVGRGSILMKFMPQILGALLKILASEGPTSALIQWHVGWFLTKLLVFQGTGLDDHNTNLFNTSYNLAHESIQKEVDGCCFDYVLHTIRSEWERCRTALGESIQSKDPIFLMELTFSQQTAAGDVTSSYASWQRMVDVVKVFILHLQLNAFICKGELPEKPLLDSTDASPVNQGKTHASDLSSASFGSEVSLGSAIPCRIAFSNAGIRDIHLIPVVNKTSGKLLLVEKHPFRGQRGVVIAVAPLAGLNPKIDKDHPTWLHLRIREFDPRSTTRKPRDFSSKAPTHTADGRWTLGFQNTKACEAARSVILEETSKQRSSVQNALDRLLKNNNQVETSDNQEE